MDFDPMGWQMALQLFAEDGQEGGDDGGDHDGDGQQEAVAAIRNGEGDRFSDTRYVIFGEQEGQVYAYCLNYMDSYELDGTTFCSELMEDTFGVSFDKEQCYEYGVE